MLPGCWTTITLYLHNGGIIPSPVTPQSAAEIVPSPSADLCTKIKLVFLRLPLLFSSLIDWMINPDGSLTSEFKDAASHFVAGDIKTSLVASPTMGWLYADGREVSRASYPALFLAIGTTYGSGDGSTTFAIPDFRGRFLYGVSTTKPLHTVGGSETHQLTVAELPSHDHEMSAKLYAAISAGSTSEKPQTAGPQKTGATGGNQAHPNLPPYETVYFFVKY